MSMQGLTKFAYVGAEAYWLAHCAVVLMWEIWAWIQPVLCPNHFLASLHYCLISHLISKWNKKIIITRKENNNIKLNLISFQIFVRFF